MDGCFASLANPADCYADSANLLAMTKNKDFAESTLLGGLESWRLRGILLFAKAKSSKNFVLGALHGIKLTRFCGFAESKKIAEFTLDSAILQNIF